MCRQGAQGHDPEDARRKEAEAAAASSVFFRSGSASAGFDPLVVGPASKAAQPTAVQNRQDQKEAFLKGGSTETRNSGNLQMPP